MTLEIIVTVVAWLLLVAAAVGAIYPMLPGSPLAIVTLIGWGWVIGSAASWTAAAVGVVLCLAGWSASYVLTGRELRQHQVPGRSIAVGMVCGIAGMFIIPVAGLFIGFAAGLLGIEWARRRDFQLALRASGAALKATGIGILIEFAMVSLAASLWTLAVVLHFTLE